jgi:hypothetical protein
MRAQPIACLSASESPSQIDASLPARLPGSGICGMINRRDIARSCPTFCGKQRGRWIETLIATSLRA